jgi:hypothetical protein
MVFVNEDGGWDKRLDVCVDGSFINRHFSVYVNDNCTAYSKTANKKIFEALISKQKEQWKLYKEAFEKNLPIFRQQNKQQG